MPTRADVDRMKRIVAKTRARGTTVRYVSGWYQRGADFPAEPKGGVIHHDASSTRSGLWGALGAIVNGRGGPHPVPGPLSQFQVARGGTPQLVVVAAGIANHAGTGGPKIGVPANRGNQQLYGAEVANNGVGEKYSDATIKAITDLFASIMEVLGEDEDQTIGHREWTPRKIDPTYDMNWMRGRIAKAMADPGEDDDMRLTDSINLKGERAGKYRGNQTKVSVDGALGDASVAVEAYEEAVKNGEAILEVRTELKSQRAVLQQILAKLNE